MWHKPGSRCRRDRCRSDRMARAAVRAQYGAGAVEALADGSTCGTVSTTSTTADAVRVPHDQRSLWSGSDGDRCQSDDPLTSRVGGEGKWTMPTSGPDAAEGIMPGGKANLRNVWTIPTHSLPRRALRDVPAQAGRAVHPGRHERARRVRDVRGAVGAGDGDDERADEGDRGTTMKTISPVGSVENRAQMDMSASQPDGAHPASAHGMTTVPATVLDPFGGSGTVALVAERLQRDAILIEISDAYAADGREAHPRGRAAADRRSRSSAARRSAV